MADVLIDQTPNTIASHGEGSGRNTEHQGKERDSGRLRPAGRRKRGRLFGAELHARLRLGEAGGRQGAGVRRSEAVRRQEEPVLPDGLRSGLHGRPERPGLHIQQSERHKNLRLRVKLRRLRHPTQQYPAGPHSPPATEPRPFGFVLMTRVRKGVLFTAGRAGRSGQDFSGEEQDKGFPKGKRLAFFL